MHKASGQSDYSKLIDIVNFPNLGSTPEQVDMTTLTDTNRQYEFGVQDTGLLEYDANYTKSDYEALKALEGSQESYAVWFGGTKTGGVVTPTGTNGKFEFTGELSVYVSEGGVNDPVRMHISIAPSSDIELAQ